MGRARCLMQRLHGGKIMTQALNTKAGELHEAAAISHRAAAEHHGKKDDVAGAEHCAKACCPRARRRWVAVVRWSRSWPVRSKSEISECRRLSGLRSALWRSNAAGPGFQIDGFCCTSCIMHADGANLLVLLISRRKPKKARATWRRQLDPIRAC